MRRRALDLPTRILAVCDVYDALERVVVGEPDAHRGRPELGARFA